MSQENLEAARKTMEAYRRRDYAGASAYLAPDVVWSVGQERPAHGPAAVREMWDRWDAEWDELETVVEEIIDAGDKVFMAVRYRGRGRVSGVEVNDRQFEVHTFRDGRCVRKMDFREREEALEAAGLLE
ncbi:MAG: nuclear transport factor 2 family protein [Thermoleophilaceae bacterium]